MFVFQNFLFVSDSFKYCSISNLITQDKGLYLSEFLHCIPASKKSRATIDQFFIKYQHGKGYSLPTSDICW